MKTTFVVVASVFALGAAAWLADAAQDAARRGCQIGEMPLAVCKIVDEACRLKDICGTAK